LFTQYIDSRHRLIKSSRSFGKTLNSINLFRVKESVYIGRKITHAAQRETGEKNAIYDALISAG